MSDNMNLNSAIPLLGGAGGGLFVRIVKRRKIELYTPLSPLKRGMTDS
jgi:hypothetical protein